MPCLSSCARKELHTRAGGAMSPCTFNAQQTLLLRYAAKPWRPLRPPKCVGAVSCCGAPCDFVLEPFLFSEQRKDVFLQPLGKLRNTIGLQMHINSACKHDTLLAPPKGYFR